MENRPHPPLTGPESQLGSSGSLAFTTAVVHAGGEEIPYLRAGRGPSVLFLLDPVPEMGGRGSGPAGGSGTRRTELALEAGPQLRALAASFRLVVPLLSPPRTARNGERWIRDVIDGLGLDRPTLVAPVDLAPLLLRVVRRDPGRVGQCVLVPSSSGDPDLGLGPTVASLLRALSFRVATT